MIFCTIGLLFTTTHAALPAAFTNKNETCTNVCQVSGKSHWAQYRSGAQEKANVCSRIPHQEQESPTLKHSTLKAPPGSIPWMVLPQEREDEERGGRGTATTHTSP